MAAEERSPNFLSSPRLKIFIKNAYHYLFSNAIYLFIIPGIISATIYRLPSLDLNQITLAQLHNYANINLHHINGFVNAPISFFLSIILMMALFFLITILRSKKVYLVDFACYKHDPCYLISRETFCEKFSRVLSSESVAFCAKVMERSGVCDKTFLYGWDDFPPKSIFACARGEAETVICGAVDDLMAKTGVNPCDIGVVIVNISTFNSVPSLSAMIVNRYKLRQDVLSYTLGGMGCSAGVIAIDLAKRLLQVQRNTYVLIMSLECPTSFHYAGDDRSRLLPNCLFRMGGVAMLLSNRASDYRTSKYELKHTVRTNHAANDRAYKSVILDLDKDGNLGLAVPRDLLDVAGKALKANLTTLGPLVLPLSEQLLFFSNLIARKVLKLKLTSTPYVPDFKRAFEHFCIHSGGKTVLDAVEKNLELKKWDMEPSRMTLYRYGNTSSSSLWYELAYAEAKGRIKKGDRVWQFVFGSGFKCGSVVWRALRSINPDREDNPWTDVIHQFPVTLV